MNMNWQVVVIAAICAVLLGGYSLLNHHEEAITTAVSDVPQPGFYMKDAAIVETAPCGFRAPA